MMMTPITNMRNRRNTKNSRRSRGSTKYLMNTATLNSTYLLVATEANIQTKSFG
jgi:hypothetical protein